MDDSIAIILKIHDEKDKAECRQSVIDQGAKIITLSPEEKREWFNRNKDTYKDFPAVKPEWIKMIRDELQSVGLE